MPYLLGCDFGGSSAKATLLSVTGQVVATASAEYPTHYPKPGWAEQDPEDSYQALIQNVRALLRESGANPSEILALILDGATHTAVLLDERDAVIRRAIYWTDKRSAPQAARLKEMEAEILRLSYNAPSSLWTLPQLMWLKENEPQAHGRIRRVLSVKDYVRYRLTGDYVTDSIEAMGFMLRDETAGVWSETLCGLAGLKPGRMPEVVEPTARLSPLTAKARAETGLCESTVVLAGATDTALEVFAAGAIAPGQATVKLATAGRICPITAQAVADRMLVCYRHVVPGLWYPGTATKSCAASNRWYRDTFGGEYEALSAAAATVPAGCEGLFYHPYLQGEITPYLDDRLRASFTGMTASHTKAHFSRAVLEGVAYSMKDCLETLKALRIAPDRATMLGGGGQSPLWRQILADMLNIPLTRVDNADSSLGGAMLAGVALGVFESPADAVARCARPLEITEPNPANRRVYEEGFEIYKAIQAALAPIYGRMSQ